MRTFHLEGGPGRNYKNDRGKVLSGDKQRPECKGPWTICHSIGGSFQDHSEFGN
jgi:hypothetical protein